MSGKLLNEEELERLFLAIDERFKSMVEHTKAILLRSFISQNGISLRCSMQPRHEISPTAIDSGPKTYLTKREAPVEKSELDYIEEIDRKRK